MDNEYYDWLEFLQDAWLIVGLIKERKLKFRNVYGLPRGGLVLAVFLSHRLRIPLILREEEINGDTLVVDDIADTGRQLEPYSRKRNFIVTLFYHRQSRVVPDIWIREKKERYIDFPWEVFPPEKSILENRKRGDER